MGWSTRTFVLDRHDCLYRLAAAKYFEMLRSPQTLTIPAFPSQRLRAASATVMLVDRLPTEVVRLVYFLLEFDATGEVKRDQLMQHAVAAIDLRMSKHNSAEDVVVDAAARFIVQGGRWKPTPALEKSIVAAALGKVRCLSARFEEARTSTRAPRRSKAG